MAQIPGKQILQPVSLGEEKIQENSLEVEDKPDHAVVHLYKFDLDILSVFPLYNLFVIDRVLMVHLYEVDLDDISVVPLCDLFVADRIWGTQEEYLVLVFQVELLSLKSIKTFRKRQF